MMNEYKIRKAIKSDIPFLADAAIAGEKGVTDKCNFSTLFNLHENTVKEYMIAMFQEEIDNCEFSLSSYFVAEYYEQPVASFGGWIEGFEGEMPSKILKSNLINFIFADESIEFLKTKSHIVKDLTVERTPEALQLEYLFVSNEHRGQNLSNLLIKKIEDTALENFPLLKKCEFQLFNNNSRIVNLFETHGYKIVKSYKASDAEILNYLPSNEKLVMEKMF